MADAGVVSTGQTSKQSSASDDFSNGMYGNAAFGLIVGLATLMTILVVRRLKKHHWEAVATAVAVVVVCAAIMFWAKPWHPPEGLVRKAIVPACFLAWMCVLLVGWTMIQRDLRATTGAAKQEMDKSFSDQKSELTELLNGRPDHTAVRKMLRTDIGNLSEHVDRVRKELVELIGEARKQQPAPATPAEPKQLDERGYAHWVKFERIEVWQAIALMLDYDPTSIANYGIGNGQIEEFLRLARSHMGTGLQIISVDGRDGRRNDVALGTFLYWAVKMKLPVSKKLATAFSERPRP